MAAESPITTSLPPPASAAAPVAAAKKALLTPEQLVSRLAKLDAVLLVLVVILAFLSASFHATNSDLLQHFAVGRLVAEGKYEFGIDPFTFTTEGVYWTNHSWLYSLLAYGIYSIPSIGGALLIVVKALLAALLTIVMLRSSWRPGERWWLPATIAGIAVLAISPRLLMQPTVISFLFLGLTLWFLIRPAPQIAALPDSADRKEGRSAGVPIALKAYWPLPVLCLFWVNLDQWFFLGPLTVGLYLAGVALQDKLQPLPRAADAPAEEPRTLGFVLLACIAACLCSPHHINVFVLPPQLGFSPAAEAIHDDPLFRAMFLSPLSTDSSNRLFSYFVEHNGLNVAGLSYFPLLLLGLLSFILTYGHWRFWRVVIWLPFACLSLYNARSIPFFAVVAAPITALNLLDWAAMRLSPTYLEGERARAWAVSGRVLTLFFAILIVLAAFSGRTQAKPTQYRFVGWGVTVEPGLEGVAKKVAAMRKEGKLPANIRWFNTHPDVVNYFAWFCPGEKGFFDQRLAPFDKIAGDYEKVRLALLPSDDPTQSDQKALPEVFDEYHIDLVICHEADLQRPPMLLRFLSDYDQWQRLEGSQGRTAIFRKKPSGKEPAKDPYQALVVNDNRLAFGPDAVTAPPHRPQREPQPREWHESYWKQPPPLYNPDGDEALVNYFIFNVHSPKWQNDYYARLEAALAASYVGQTLLNGPSSVVAAFLGPMTFPTLRQGDKPTWRQNLALKLHEVYRQPGMFDKGPPASLYLAIRSVRRALHRNPDDASLYLVLARLYLTLQDQTREGGFAMLLPELREIRSAQICGALQQAIRLDNDLIDAHALLVNQYTQMGYIDLVLKHKREQLRCIQENPKLAGNTEEQQAKGIQGLDDEVKKIEEEVNKRQGRFELVHQKRSAAEKAAIALAPQNGFGLAETARKELQSIDFKQLSEKDGNTARAAACMYTELLFKLGELSVIRETVRADEDVDFGYHPQYRVRAAAWYRIRLAAADGDYAYADEELEKLLKTPPPKPSYDVDALDELTKRLMLQVTPGENANLVARFLRLAEELLYQAPLATNLVFPIARAQWEALFQLWRMDCVQPTRRETDWIVLRGWLALEAGDTKKAAKQFRSALEKQFPPERRLPFLGMLGATSPIEAFSTLQSSRMMAHPQFDINGFGLAVMGLQWLQGEE